MVRARGLAQPGDRDVVHGGRPARGAALEVVSASDRLVCFGDGIEADALTISWGQRLRVAVSETRLRLVV